MLDFRLFLFRDGLVRLCTTQYSAPSADNEEDVRMHLTNYAVNKHSENFECNEEADNDGEGSKRSLRWFLSDFEENHGKHAINTLWGDISDLCAKTILMGMPGLDLQYHSRFPKDLCGNAMPCRSFELLGLDVMIDSDHKPWLIEINCLPSFATDSPLDENIKKRAVEQTLDMTCEGISQRDRAMYRLLAHKRRIGEDLCGEELESWKESWKGTDGDGGSLLDQESYKDFERVYPPVDNPELAAKYDNILERTRSIFKHPAAGSSSSRATESSERPTPKKPSRLSTSLSQGSLKPSLVK